MQVQSVSPVLSEVLDRLVSEAVAREVPAEVAEEAARATSRALKAADGPVTGQTRRRAETYFSAVVRRRVTRRGAARSAAARFVLASVVEDLRSTGRAPVDIWDELERGWATQVPEHVLEEYRLRLCG
jgi:hypothetical protein